MPRILGIDWDHGWLRVVEATHQRGAVTIRQARAWPEKVGINPAQAEEAGQRLKARLQEAGISPAPVVACVGRDRVVIRDVRYPAVPPDEVPGVVRFQAAKELTFAAEESVIDYSLISLPWPTGEKRAVAAVVRTELLASYREMCQAAGLKLEGLTLRPLALLAGWQAWARASGTADQDTRAILLDQDLIVAHGGEVLFSRTLRLPPGAGLADLAGEVRRSLAGFAGQYPRWPVRTAYVAGPALTAGVGELATALRVPVHVYEPVPADLSNTADAASLASAVGLVQTFQAGGLALDFVHPKQPVVGDPNQKRKLAVYAAAAAVPVLLAVGWYWWAMADRDNRIDELIAEKAQLQKQVTTLTANDFEKRFEAANAWFTGEMVMADELYDLIAHFPDVSGVRITKATWAPARVEVAAPTSRSAIGTAPKPAVSAAAKAATPIGTLTLEAAGESAEALERLRVALMAEPNHWRLDPGAWLPDTPGPRQALATLKVFRVEPKAHAAILEPGKHVTATNAAPPPRRGGFPNRPTFRPGGNP